MGWEVSFLTVDFSSCVDLSKLNDVDLLTRVDLSSMTISQPRLTGRAFKYSQYFLLIREVGHVDKWSRPASNIDYKNKVLYEIHWNVRKKKNKLKSAMLLYLASELRLFKQSAVIGSNFKVKAYKKEGEAKLIIYHSFW